MTIVTTIATSNTSSTGIARVENIRIENIRIGRQNASPLFLLRRMMLVHGGIVEKTALSLIRPWRLQHCHGALLAGAVLIFNASLTAAVLGLWTTTVEGTFTGLGDTINKASNSAVAA